MAPTIREKCERRLEGLKKVRQPYEDEWREIARFAQPSRSRFLQSEANRTFRRSNKAVYNSHGILSFRTLAGGMTSGLSSPSRPWFRLKPYNTDMEADHTVTEWLAECEKRMYGFIAGTNFYTSVRSGYAELGMFGTSACVMVDHDEVGAVCHQLTAGEYWIGCGDKAEPNAMYRRVPLTVAQMVQMFPWERLSKRVQNCYNQSQYEEICEVIQAIEPNTGRDVTKLDGPNKAWRSFYWDTQDGDKTNGYLKIAGMDEQSFWAPRWEVSGGDAWGTCPGHDALPDLRELQLQTKRKTEATGFMVKPEKIAPATVKLTGQAGNIVAASESDAKAVGVPYQMPYQAIAAIMEDMERCSNAVDRLTYADLFMSITNMQGIQPRNIEEIASRNEEKLTQLGPVIERVNTEQLEVVIDRTWGIMSRKGMFPPAPESLQGQAIKVDFVSILAQMQRMVGLGQIEKTFAFVQAAMGVDPSAADKIDLDVMIDEYADRAGTPPKVLRGAEEIKALRAARQQQQQMAQMAELMPAAREGTEALANVAAMGGGMPGAI